ncbi:MAG: TolC family protein [Chitinophagales bacterium]|nr:TolC family protein [Chitinophagales bacterium]
MKTCITLLLSVIFRIANAQQATDLKPDTLRMSVQECVDYALQHQHNVKNTRLDAEIAKRKTQEYTGLSLPQINGSLEFTDFLKLPTSLIPGEFFGGEAGTFIPVKFGTQYNVTAGAQASQLIFDGRYFLGLKASRALADQAQLAVTGSEIDVVNTVMKAYLSTLINVERVKQLDANIDRLQKIFHDTKAQFEAGFVEKLDVDRISVSYNNLLTERDNVRNSIALSYYLLKYNMGMNGNDGLLLTDSIREDDFQSVLQNAGTSDLNNRIEYQQLLTGLALSEMNVKQYKLEYLPTLYGFASLSYQAQREKLNFFNNEAWYPTGIAGFKLSLPIFDGLQKARQLQQAKLSVEKTNNDIEDFKNAVSLQVASAKTSLQNAISSLNTQRTNLDLAKEVVDISRKKFDQGVGSSLEVTNGESSLREAQVNYLNALYDAWVARIDLQKSLGTLYKK